MSSTKIPNLIPCPYCAEPIQTDALKCRFCGEWIKGKPPITSQVSNPKPVDFELKRQRAEAWAASKRKQGQQDASSQAHKAPSPKSSQPPDSTTTGDFLAQFFGQPTASTQQNKKTPKSSSDGDLITQAIDILAHWIEHLNIGVGRLDNALKYWRVGALVGGCIAIVMAVSNDTYSLLDVFLGVLALGLCSGFVGAIVGALFARPASHQVPRTPANHIPTPNDVKWPTKLALVLVTVGAPFLWIMADQHGPPTPGSTISSDGWLPAGTHIWTDAKLYCGRDKKWYVGKVLGGNRNYITPSGEIIRGIKLQMANGDIEWKDRNVVSDLRNYWYIKADDPALQRMEWREYQH